MRRPVFILLATATLVLTASSLALAGGGGHGGACRGFGEGADLVLRDSCFEGIGHVIDAGQPLVVTNEGELPHTITATDGSFDSGIIDPGESFRVSIDAAGPVPIYCTLHGTADGQGMAGLLVVEEPAASGAQTVASPANGAAWPWAVAALLAAAVATALVRSLTRGGGRPSSSTDRTRQPAPH